jgi:hypothetical protein
MMADFESLMELKDKIEVNGFKNEFYKQKFAETKDFDIKTKKSWFSSLKFTYNQ